ncbi:MAG: putative integral membrane protein (TIGR00697 family) [Gammaproteobacteria bacterium]|jgi:uncharacterized integral membrane protein (TIGR00697 family)
MDPRPGTGGLDLGQRRESLYTFFCCAFVVVLVLTNIVGTKLFVLFPDGGPAWILGGRPWTLTSGILTYPLTFFLTDIVSEIWGHRRAQRMVVLGFLMSALMLLVLQVAIHLPPSPVWVPDPRFGIADAESMQRAFHATFSNPSILLAASMIAYLVAQLFDVRLYRFWWRVTGGKHMWLRNNGSTMISQLVDTIIVNGIFLRWGLHFEWPMIAQVILAVYLCKVVLALLDTPLIYVGRHLLERWLGIPHDPARARAPLE